MSSDASGDEGVRRLRMVEEQLRARGLSDEATLAAMRAVPRHLFVPEELEHEAYYDAPLPIGLGQTISQPYMVALMTALLGVDVRSRVLEIGAGCGYQTAVLAEVAGEVWALELLAPLAERARRTLADLGYRNARVAVGDGRLGWPERAPFDGILVAAAADDAPPALIEQLGLGGRLVIPLGHGRGDQVLTVYERTADGVAERHQTRCRFVPLIDPGRRDERRGGETAPAGRPAPPFQRSEEGGTLKAVDVRVDGIVQGVFYRSGAQAEGRRLGLRGWVKNLSDGAVALHLQGDPSVVDAMLDWCRVGPPAARVARLEVSDASADGSLTGFEVR